MIVSMNLVSSRYKKRSEIQGKKQQAKSGMSTYVSRLFVVYLLPFSL